MSESQLQVSRPPLHSLATRIIFFAFLCTFATALAVSWIAIQSTATYLTERVEERFPAVLERASAGVEAWLATRGDGAPKGNAEHAQLAAMLDRHRPPDASLLLADAAGRVMAGAPAGEDPMPEQLPPEALETGDVPILRHYTTSAGVRVVGSARRIAGPGWTLVLEEPFQRAFAPVLAVVERVFVVDLCVILLFSFLAFKITTAVVRPIETLSEGARRIAQGQFDHEVPEPESQDEIGLLARTFNDMMRRLRGYQTEIETANRNLMDRNVELQQAKETFEQLSITDGLTKLHNHRFFQDHLTREIKRVTRTGEPLSMLLVDIDDFKSLNDRFGHAAGDELLMGLARVLNDIVRDSDLLARYGGEEFVVVAANTEVHGAYRLAEKIRTAVAETSFILDDSLRPMRVTVSIGVACYHGNRKTFFQATDRALYRAKAEGKNCVVVDGEEDLT
jgi:diguanylate cyclase (GGDEF)-like protein